MLLFHSQILKENTNKFPEPTPGSCVFQTCEIKIEHHKLSELCIADCKVDEWGACLGYKRRWSWVCGCLYLTLLPCNDGDKVAPVRTSSHTAEALVRPRERTLWFKSVLCLFDRTEKNYITKFMCFSNKKIKYEVCKEFYRPIMIKF